MERKVGRSRVEPAQPESYHDSPLVFYFYYLAQYMDIRSGTKWVQYVNVCIDLLITHLAQIHSLE